MLREWFWDLEDFARARGSHRRSPGHGVYHWGDWHRSYPKYVIPNAFRLNALIGESAQDILDRLPAGLLSLLFHIDLSDTRRFIGERERLVRELRSKGIVALNERAVDITSRTTQAILRAAGLPDVIAAPDGDPEETLIVKSDYNYAGRSERMLSGPQRELLGLTHLPPAIRRKQDYFLVKRKDVAASAWADLSIHVQRFAGNSEGRLFRFRICLDRWAVSSCLSDGPVKDFQYGRSFREELIQRGSYDCSLSRKTLEQAYRGAEAFGLDFGAMDAIVDDAGSCYVVDVNTTPGISQVKGPRIDFMREAWGNVRKDALA